MRNFTAYTDDEIIELSARVDRPSMYSSGTDSHNTQVVRALLWLKDKEALSTEILAEKVAENWELNADTVKSLSSASNDQTLMAFLNWWRSRGHLWLNSAMLGALNYTDRMAVAELYDNDLFIQVAYGLEQLEQSPQKEGGLVIAVPYFQVQFTYFNLAP